MRGNLTRLGALRTIATIAGLGILIYFGIIQTNRANFLAARRTSVVQPSKQFIQENKERGTSNNQSDNTTNIVGIATLVILVGQSWIFARQASLMRRTIDVYDRQANIMSGQLDAAVDAASAAKTSADMLISLERPWLVPVVDHGHLTDVLNRIVAQGPSGLEIPIKFVNEGRTSAFPGFFYVSVGLGVGELPDMEKPFITRIKKRIISPREDGEYPLAAVTNLGAEEAGKLLDCQTALWFLGKLEYSDFFGKSHATGFCFYYDGMMDFEPWGDKTYNYMT